VATALAVPFTFAALCRPEPAVFWSGMVLAEILLFASTGPINAVIIAQVPPTYRAAALAATNFTIHVLGDVPSPPLIGWLSDHGSLERAVLLVPVAIAIAAVTWLGAAVLEERRSPCIA
jgi:hypothetical protein